jgi:hypothetical protein
MKNLIILSDFHCGHRFGLTPPGWLPIEPAERNAEWVKANRALFSWYEAEMKRNAPYDVIFVNGDCIEGKGSKSGGTELIASDLEEQSDMATELIRCIPKRKGCKIFMSRGTPYHVSSKDGEDWENIIAERVGAVVDEHLWVEIEGIMFDLKHHPSGGSQVPHGRHTAVAKDFLWNALWHERKMQPKSQVIIRSHQHYHIYSGGPDWLAMITPALQGAGSKFGARRCAGLVDFGFVTFNINKGEYSWQTHTSNIAEQKAKAHTLK